MLPGFRLLLAAVFATMLLVVFGFAQLVKLQVAQTRSATLPPPQAPLPGLAFAERGESTSGAAPQPRSLERLPPFDHVPLPRTRATLALAQPASPTEPASIAVAERPKIAAVLATVAAAPKLRLNRPELVNLVAAKTPEHDIGRNPAPAPAVLVLGDLQPVATTEAADQPPVELQPTLPLSTSVPQEVEPDPVIVATLAGEEKIKGEPATAAAAASIPHHVIPLPRPAPRRAVHKPAKRTAARKPAQARPAAKPTALGNPLAALFRASRPPTAKK